MEKPSDRQSDNKVGVIFHQFFFKYLLELISKSFQFEAFDAGKVLLPFVFLETDTDGFHSKH